MPGHLKPERVLGFNNNLIRIWGISSTGLLGPGNRVGTGYTGNHNFEIEGVFGLTF